MKILNKRFISLLAIAGLFACQVDSNCITNNVDYVTFSTKSINANLEETNLVLPFDSIISPQSNEVFYRYDTISDFQLPLSPVEDTTEFYFYYRGTSGDTLRLAYEKYNAVQSPECGIDIEFIGMDTTFHTFDSLIIVNDTLKQTINAPNIKLFIF